MQAQGWARAMKRKFSATDTCRAQFAELRSIPGLPHARCRELVAFFRDDGRGGHCCKREEEKFPEMASISRTLTLPGEVPLDVPYNALPELIHMKAQACPLFAAQMAAALEATNGALTLILFSDEATPGNVLAADLRRKCNLYYVAVLQWPTLHLESLWLPFAVVRSGEREASQHSYAEILTQLLRRLRADVEHGFCVDLGPGRARMAFVRRVILLQDHEGHRSLSGCKGAAGKKPCLKCVNILSAQSEAPPGHFTIATAWRAEVFCLQTDQGLAATLEHLRACPTRAARERAEVALGWGMDGLAASVFSAVDLQDWISIEHSIHFDAMHQYWSNGIVAQELGLWQTRLQEHGVTLEKLRAWVCIGWRACRTQTKLLPLFSRKLFRAGRDYRGDAAACLMALPLCWAFSCEVLPTREDVGDATRSLRALYDVARCLGRCKINPEAAVQLTALQEAHMKLFVAAYGAAEVRPKWHYALHLQEQIRVCHRHLDCFTCERKHRSFKSEVAPNQKALWCMPKSTLRHLTWRCVKTAQPAARLTGRTLGALRRMPMQAAQLKLPPGSRFAKGAEIGCVEFARGHFFQVSSTVSVEVCGAVTSGTSVWLLCKELLRASADHAPFPMWERTAQTARSLVPLHEARGRAPFSMVREGARWTWFL